MSEFTAYRCDQCTRLKAEANKWYWAVRLPGARLVVAPWDLPIRDEQAVVIHLCGRNCVMQWIAKELTEVEEEEK